jgi:hypothetical protein
VATAWPDSPRPYFPTDTQSPLRDEGSYKYRASSVFISILSGADNPASRYPSLLSHHTTFTFHGGAPGHALHRMRYQELPELPRTSPLIL